MDSGSFRAVIVSACVFVLTILTNIAAFASEPADPVAPSKPVSSVAGSLDRQFDHYYLARQSWTQVRWDVDELGRRLAYRNEQRAFFSYVFSPVLILLGTLESTGVTNWHRGASDAIPGAVLLGRGVLSLGIATGRVSMRPETAAARYERLVWDSSTSDDDLLNFLAGRARVSRLARTIPGSIRLVAGAGAVIAGALQEQVSSDNNTRAVYWTAGALLLAAGVEQFVRRTPEELVLHCLRSGGPGANCTPHHGYPRYSLIPSMFHQDRQLYAGAVLTIR